VGYFGSIRKNYFNPDKFCTKTKPPATQEGNTIGVKLTVETFSRFTATARLLYWFFTL
jgi:hypothetical protein